MKAEDAHSLVQWANFKGQELSGAKKNVPGLLMMFSEKKLLQNKNVKCLFLYLVLVRHC